MAYRPSEPAALHSTFAVGLQRSKSTKADSSLAIVAQVLTAQHLLAKVEGLSPPAVEVWYRIVVVPGSPALTLTLVSGVVHLHNMNPAAWDYHPQGLQTMPQHQMLLDYQLVGDNAVEE